MGRGGKLAFISRALTAGFRLPLECRQALQFIIHIRRVLDPARVVFFISSRLGCTWPSTSFQTLTSYALGQRARARRARPSLCLTVFAFPQRRTGRGHRRWLVVRDAGRDPKREGEVQSVGTAWV